MARIGDFDKDANLQGWFDETLANAPRGWFDKSAINGNNADTQTAHGGVAASPKATRAHDRPLEWWLEVEKASWAAAAKTTAPKESKKSSSTTSSTNWYAAFKEMREEVRTSSRVPMLPLDARSNVITLVPREDLSDAEPLLERDAAMLSYLDRSSLERAAGIDSKMEMYTNVVRPLLLVASGALAAYAIGKSKRSSKPAAKKRSSQPSAKRETSAKRKTS